MDYSASSELQVDAGSGEVATKSRAAQAAADLVAGLRKSWLWTALAVQDIRLRYRGSVLGPLWITVTTVIMVGAMGVLYARLFHMQLTHYFPFLTIGLVLWGFVAGLISEGCGTFTAVQGIIQQVQLPFSVHVYRLIYRNLLVFAHNFVIVPIVLFFFPTPIDWHVLLLVPALALISLNGVWICVLLGMASARFRDVPPIVGSFLQVVFFATPIFWSADQLGDWQTAAELNPLFAAVDIIRAPLMGAPPAPYSWIVLMIVTVIGAAFTFAFFARFRSRIAFWV